MKNTQDLNMQNNDDVIKREEEDDLNESKTEKEEKGINVDIKLNQEIENKNKLEKNDDFSQVYNQENIEQNEEDKTKSIELLKENNIENGKEKENQNENEIINNNNKEFFDNKLKSGNQTLESDGNPNEKIVRGKKNYNKKILNNKNLLIKEQNQEKDKQKKLIEQEQKRQEEENKKKLLEKKKLNRKLLEREMNEIKKKLQKKREQQQKKENEKNRNKRNELINNYADEKINSIFKQDINQRSSKRSVKFEEKFEMFNTPKNNDICSQLLQATMNNEKKLLLVPYAKQKEKIKKTFNTIGNSNGITYSEYRIINGNEKDKENIANIIREDNRKSVSKKKEYSEMSSIRKSDYSNINRIGDFNPELNF